MSIKRLGGSTINVHRNYVGFCIRSALSGLNECANLFQWVTSVISSLKFHPNETQKERLQGDIHQLHRDLQCLTDTLPAMYNLINRVEWRIHDHYVAELLWRLKAEDILDEFRWYERKVSVESNAISVQPVIDFIVSLKLASTRWLISRRGSIIFTDSLRKWDYFKQFHGLTKHSLLQKTLPRRANIINRGGHPLQKNTLIHDSLLWSQTSENAS
jgi:uncharacterized protein (DUF2132 family)